jgi:hypothetical protein
MSENAVVVELPEDVTPRAKIFALEDVLREMPQVDLPLVHRFTKGLYAREMFIPKGSVLVGKIHRCETLSIISQGDISILTETGVARVKAPCTIISPPLTKRAGYAHEDTVITGIWATDETDLEKLEDELIAAHFPDEISAAEILSLKDS